MDFANAALLIAVVVGLAQLAKTFLFGTTQQRKVAGVVLAIAIVSVLLVAQSAWGDEQIVGGETLDGLNLVSQLLVAVLLAGGASTVWEVFGAVKNIGVPTPSKAQQEALDAGATQYMRANLPNGGGSHPGATDL